MPPLEPALPETTLPAPKTVLVTGAAKGIGRATVLRFAAAGWRVVAWDLGAEAPDLEEEAVRAGGTCRYQAVDVADGAAVDTAVDTLAALGPRLDAVVANAGVVRDGQLIRWRGGVSARLSEEDFDRVLAVNLKGVFLTVRATAPLLIAGGGGSISVASSVVGASGNFGQTNYAATKAGVVAMVGTWTRELGRYGIRVNAVAPGFIATDMVGSMPQQVVERVVEHTPLKRLGRPEEVAEAYFWLASDAASFVTGTVLEVDGGLIVGS